MRSASNVLVAQIKEVKLRFNRGQTVTEMALFGSMILLILGSLLSYLQSQNDQQYVQMEAFRRALQRACTYLGAESEGAGASVQFTMVQNRRHTDLSGGFRKGSSQSLSSSSSVFWAVPRLGEGGDDRPEAPNLIVFRINEDEKEWNYRDFVSKDHDSTDDEGEETQRYWTFETEDMTSDTQLAFNETAIKQEDTQGITNTKSSTLREHVHVNIPYTVKEVDKDDDAYEVPKESGTLWDLNQNLYRDTNDGQYKYSSQVPADYEVVRTRTWRTDF